MKEAARGGDGGLDSGEGERVGRGHIVKFKMSAMYTSFHTGTRNLHSSPSKPAHYLQQRVFFFNVVYLK